MMTKGDFYCGAFLSFLLNNGIMPALFEERIDINRKIYDFTTNKDDFRVYVKYSEKPSSESESKGSSIWNFPFTDIQLDEIKDIRSTDNKKLYFAFVCGRLSLNKSRIALISHDIVLQCIELNRTAKYKDQSVKIRLIKGHWNFDVYGTKRADKLEGQDNTLKVRVKNMDEIFGIKQDCG
ncbi:hypothetical protein PRVXH_000509 [Proteinivorax hydrogeniformans]|uniref:Uncharacterized protein n=1 Tax=Proteinivorax hydrogeniformans TaxID=1826727 RepID=A0AAU8HV05_9FIRM